MKSIPFIVPLLIAAATITGCATARPRVTRSVYDAGAHFVKLVEMTVPEGQAPVAFDHPVDFTAEDMRYILRTLRIARRAGRGWDTPEPVLTRSAQRLLAPHLAAAFSQATHTEYVAFKITHNVPGIFFPRHEITTGTMFLRDSAFHFQLEHFHTSPDDLERITYRPTHTTIRGEARLEPGEGMRRMTIPDGAGTYDHWLVADWPALQARLKTRRQGRARRAAARSRRERPAAESTRTEWEPFDEDVRFRDEGNFVVEDEPPLAEPSAPMETRLRELERLRERNLITEGEYQRKRRALLEEP